MVSVFPERADRTPSTLYRQQHTLKYGKKYYLECGNKKFPSIPVSYGPKTALKICAGIVEIVKFYMLIQTKRLERRFHQYFAIAVQHFQFLESRVCRILLVPIRTETGFIEGISVVWYCLIMTVHRVLRELLGTASRTASRIDKGSVHAGLGALGPGQKRHEKGLYN